MIFQYSRHNIKKGFTLVEAMVFLFIFSVTVVTFYRTFASGTKAISNVKSRIVATALANEKMEIVRNLDYEAVGTDGGAPAGSIPQEETVTKNG